MHAKKQELSQEELFKSRLDQMLDQCPAVWLRRQYQKAHRSFLFVL